MLNAAMMIFAPSGWRLNLSLYFKTLQRKIPPSVNSLYWRVSYYIENNWSQVNHQIMSTWGQILFYQYSDHGVKINTCQVIQVSWIVMLFGNTCSVKNMILVIYWYCYIHQLKLKNNYQAWQYLQLILWW